MPGGCVCMRAPRRCWDHGVPKPAFTMLQRRCCVHVIAMGPARSMRAFVGRMRPSSVRQRALGSTRMHGGSFQRLTSLPPPRAPSPLPPPPPDPACPCLTAAAWRKRNVRVIVANSVGLSTFAHTRLGVWLLAGARLLVCVRRHVIYTHSCAYVRTRAHLHSSHAPRPDIYPRCGGEICGPNIPLRCLVSTYSPIGMDVFTDNQVCCAAHVDSSEEWLEALVIRCVYREARALMKA